MAILAAVTAAAYAVGALLGFIFGVPRHIKPPDAASAAAGGAELVSAQSNPRAFSANSNLVDVSDWLTKILLGAGLVSLGALGGSAADLGDWVSAQMPGGGAPAIVVGLALHGAVTGFLVGFLWAALVVRGWFERSEADFLRAFQQVVYDSSTSSSDNESDEVVSSRTEEEPPPAARSRATEVKRFVAGLSPAEERILGAADYRALARQFKRAGLYREAVDAYLRASEKDPHDPQPLNLAGVILSRDLGQTEEAASLYRRAIDLDPTYISPIYNLSCNEARRGNTNKALELLNKAIDADRERYVRLARRDAEGDGPFAPIKDDPRFMSLTA